MEELEWKTYDWRVQSAVKQQPPCATNLGFVRIHDQDISNIAEGFGGELDYQYGLYWPRAVYGRLVTELKAQGTKLVAFDILFGERRYDHPLIERGTNGPPISSDEFFAESLQAAAGTVAIATSKELPPDPLFRNASPVLGDISTDRDSDGVLRRARAFQILRFWDGTIEGYARQFGFDPNQAIGAGVDLPLLDSTNVFRMRIPLESDHSYDVGAFKAQFEETSAPAGFRLRRVAYRDRTVWHMGIVMAAAELGLDLENAEIDLKGGRIRLPGTNGVERVLSVDDKANFFVDWSVKEDDARLTTEHITFILQSDKKRRDGKLHEVKSSLKGKVVIVGSTATGNDLTDRGSTPLQNDTFLVGKHWNVANSIIMNRFITRSPLWLELLAVVVMGSLGAGLTWKLHAPWATLAVLGIIPGYLFIAHHVFVEYRYWIPIVLPVAAAMLLNHLALLTYNIIFEQREKRRVTGVFAKLVSPNVVTQLLKRDVIKLEGTREQITVFFADVRGFTKLTDVNQTRAEKYVSDHHLTGAAAEAHFDKNAKDTLDTVNLYLAAIADQVKKHNGTLDKYIGDCVMAFWGAPTPNEKHAVSCVRAAMDAQIAMHLINVARAAENQQQEAKNLQMVAAGEEPRHLLPLLALGTGINTGTAIVGMMGSEAHIINYTVFGREVNLASRLEGVSGHSRIVVGEATFRDLEKLDVELGALCVELEPVTPKGFSMPVRIWEVPWKKFLPPGTPELPSAEAKPVK